MHRSLITGWAAVLAVAVAVAVLPVSRAGAVDLPLLTPETPPERAATPVAAPAITDPEGRVRGTMIMMHGGGWTGHNEYAQDQLLGRPGEVLLRRGWRIVSVDYEEGTDGLQDVLNAAGSELARRTSNGPVCLYGESSGGHLSLVAAARLRAIDCVVAVGAPTDLGLYREEAAASGDAGMAWVLGRIDRVFGTTEAENAPWDPVTLAPRIHADVLLLREADDRLVSARHNERFAATRPTTQTAELQSGGDELFVHGSLSPAGLARYASVLGSFVDRAVTARRDERRAARLGCKGAARRLGDISVGKLRSVVRCLARKDRKVPSRTGRWRRTSYRLRGDVTAGRVWGHLRKSKSRRRALAALGRRRATLTVRRSDRSRVTVRAKRR